LPVSWPLWLTSALWETLADALEFACAPLPLAETEDWLESEIDVCESADVWAAAFQVMTADASATTKSFLLISPLRSRELAFFGGARVMAKRR
jgi:hypothetical protein